jgi:hypothetical protein
VIHECLRYNIIKIMSVEERRQTLDENDECVRMTTNTRLKNEAKENPKISCALYVLYR